MLLQDLHKQKSRPRAIKKNKHVLLTIPEIVMRTFIKYNHCKLCLIITVLSTLTLGCGKLHSPLGMMNDEDIDLGPLSPEVRNMAEKARDQINHYQQQVKSAQQKM